jgi:transposase-like protein
VELTDLRTRRRFSDEFKQAAVSSLETTPVADVARLCDVSVSVLHRWRRQFSGHAVKPVDSRRKFTREFKADAMERIAGGSSILEIAAALAIRANTLHRWRKEAREFGEDAFSGYGNTRDAPPAARIVKISLDTSEHQRLRSAFENSPARSLPDFARALLLDFPSEDVLSSATVNFEQRLGTLAATLNRLAFASLAK